MESRRLIIAVVISLFVLMAWEHLRMKLWPMPQTSRRSVVTSTNPAYKGSLAGKEVGTNSNNVVGSKQNVKSKNVGVIRNPKSNDNITIGGLDSQSGYYLFAQLTTMGASIETVKLSQFSESVRDKTKRYTLLSPVKYPSETKFSMSTERIVILRDKGGPIEINLEDVNWFYSVSSNDNEQRVIFYVDITDGNHKLVRLSKTYIVKKQSYDMFVDCKIENLSKRKFSVELYQFGVLGIRKEDPRSDYRKVYAGLRLASSGDIQIKKVTRKEILKKKGFSYRLDDIDEEVIWAGQANKYFAALMCPVDSTGQANGKRIKSVYAYCASDIDDLGEDLTTLWQSRKILLSPKSKSDLDFELYLGPKSNTIFNRVEKYRKRYYAGTIEYTWCTMQWLAEIMIKLLKFLYLITRNYGLAIILMVVIVRALLHPITKSSQLNMMRMQQNMQKLQPKMQAIREKYKNNREAMNKAIMELYREEGINPAGQMLGCLPMMLQMPIWVALWTSLNNTFELRHQPFFLWIRDLAGPDSLIHFSKAIEIPLISGMVGPIHDLNILPLLLVISMLLQQKFMAQPTAPDADPAQAKQQKVMFYFMGIFFGLILYNAPSGLNLYILTSNFLGVIENKRIRRHLEEEKNKPAAPKRVGKSTSWWAKLQKKMEQMAREYEEQQKKSKSKGK